ncbi:DMT family transporter [Salinarimonas rosea]|uniref:DMT family transporter n=1 Tax=Salinarimonas rosea TaxID=552063 RepID=UPI00040E88B4|nr:DMT family transporter [Salinarimonas rosea]
MPVPPRLLAIVVMALWAACYPLIAVALEDAPHLTFAALRAALGGAALMAVALATGAARPATRSQWRWIAVAGIGMTGIGYFGMFHGAEFVSPGLATVVSNAQPLIAGLLAALVLGERTGALGWSGLAIGLVGIAVIALPSFAPATGGTSPIGLGYVLLATTGVAVGNIAIKRLANEVAPVMAMGLQLLIGAALLAALAILLEDPTSIDWTGRFVAALLGLALPGTALAFWLWQITLARLAVSQAVAFGFIVPVIGLTVGWAFFEETVTALTIAGAALSVVGVYLAAGPLGGRRT